MLAREDCNKSVVERRVRSALYMGIASEIPTGLETRTRDKRGSSEAYERDATVRGRQVRPGLG